MLAIATADALILADSATLKKSPQSIPPNVSLITQPTAISWSPDNTALFLASANNIFKYEAFSGALSSVYSTHDGSYVSQITVQDKDTIIMAINDQLQFLHTTSQKVTQIISSHNAPITSSSLSNNGNWLASSSTSAVHVHNLQSGSHSVLRGLSTSQRVNVCAFHPHSQTKLLVGAGNTTDSANT